MEDRNSPAQPAIIPRPEHSISRANISSNALKVLYRLRDAGHRACLVGGGVRDLLIGRKPKDFDVATDARPEQVHRLFRNCRLIGRRFRLAHVQFGQDIVEVATFRAHGDDTEDGDGPTVERAADGRILSDNVYGSIEDDAWRRDFTINALYYDIANFAVLDYVGGMDDLRRGLIRLIGDPVQRYQEDPVRMLRAVRFAGKLDFRLDPATEVPLRHMGQLLEKIPPARLFDEILKLFLGGSAVRTFELLRHYQLFGWLFPATERCLSQAQQPLHPKSLLLQALASTDSRLAEGKSVNPAFLLAALLWEPLQDRMRRHGDHPNDVEALQEAADIVIQDQIRRVALPRRHSLPIREIWEFQQRLTATTGKRPLRLLGHPRFRAGYDFLLLRAGTDEQAAELANWWTRFLALDDAGRADTLQPPAKGKSKSRRRRNRRSARPSDQIPPSGPDS